MGSLRYFFREVLINLRRSPLMTLSSVTTVMILQLILGGFALLWLNLDYWTQTFTQQVQVVAFLQDDLAPEAVEKLQKNMQTIGHVIQVRFVGRDEAFAQLQKDMKGKISLADVGENPLPDRYDVRVDEARFLVPVAEKVARLKGVYRVKYGGEIAQRLIKLSTTVSWVGSVISALLVLATLTVVGNTIRLTVFARRREIEIMQMVGASRWFIQLPFVMEGIIQSLLGSGLAMLILTPSYENLVDWLGETLPFLPCVASDQLLWWLYLWLLLLGIIIGALGSLVSVNRYLKI